GMGGDDTSIEMALAQSLNDSMEVSTARSWETIAEVSSGAVKARSAATGTGVPVELSDEPADDFEKLLFDGVDADEEIKLDDVELGDDQLLDFVTAQSSRSISQYEAS